MPRSTKPCGLLLLGALFLVACSNDDPSKAVANPDVARGRAVFLANCVACHGVDGRGTVDGPSLADSLWLRGRGTYEEILQRVTHGVARRESATGRPMPMRGWSPVSDDEVRAVAAYVWWLAHGR